MHHARVGSDPEQGILLHRALMYCVKLLPGDYKYNLVAKQSIRPSLRHWDNQQSTTVHVGLREFYACRPWGQVLGTGR
jgi:hypothetical protein